MRTTPYIPTRRTISVGCDVGGEFPGIDVVVASLTLDEIRPLLGVQPYEELAVKIAPYVLSWNVHLTDASGKSVAVPAPATAGPTVFTRLDASLLVWLRHILVSVPGNQVFAGIESPPDQPDDRVVHQA